MRRIREELPSSNITLLAGPIIPSLMKGNPYVDEVLPFDPKKPGGWGPNRDLMQLLRQKQFHAAFILNRSLHSAAIIRGAGIPIRIGHNTEYRGPLLTQRIAYDWKKSDVLCSLDLLIAAGIPADICLPELSVSPDERNAMRSRLHEMGWSERPIVGIQPGANDPYVREWGAEKYARLANELTDKYGFQVVIMGTPDQQETVDKMIASMSHKPISLVGKTDIREAMATIALCKVWIGNDGGLLHMAAALSPASIGIFGPHKALRWGYNTANHRSIFKPTVHPAKDHAETRRCLDSITVEEVLTMADEILNGEEGAK